MKLPNNQRLIWTKHDRVRSLIIRSIETSQATQYKAHTELNKTDSKNVCGKLSNSND